MNEHLRLVGAVAIGLFSFAAAASAQWQSERITDHLRGDIGVGTTAGGTLTDGRNSKSAVLRIYCADNSTVINVEAQFTYFGSGSLTARYSLDGGPIQSVGWDTCQGGKCAGMWGGSGVPLLKSMYDKRELKLVLQRTYAEPLNATFSVVGAKDA